MGLTFVSTIIVTVLQTVLCGFSFWVFVDYIPVLLFCLRCVGATFKIKALCIVEALPLGLWVMWDFMFGGFDQDWPRMLIFLGCVAVVIGIMVYENIFYVIVEKDERTEDDNEDS